jgi:hypothetical protein
VFAVKGHGTVATGTLLAGRVDLAKDTRFTCVPVGLSRHPSELRARALHVRGDAQGHTAAGNRVALNLGNVATSDLSRGDVITTGHRVHRRETVLAVLTHLAHDDLPWRTGTTVEVCCGTTHTTARIIPTGPLADTPETDLSPGTSDSAPSSSPGSSFDLSSRTPAQKSSSSTASGTPSSARKSSASLSSGTPAPNAASAHLSSGTPAPNAASAHLSSGTPRDPSTGPRNPTHASPDLSSGTPRDPSTGPRNPTHASPDLSSGTPRDPSTGPRNPTHALPDLSSGTPRTAAAHLSSGTPDSPDPADPAPAPRRFAVPPGATAIVRLRLDAPLPVWHGQRLILRTTRDGELARRHGHTVGGGLVVDPHPPAGRGQRPRWLALARALHHGSPSERVLALLRDAGALGITRDELEHRAGIVDLEPVLADISARGLALALDEQRWLDATVLPPLAAAAAAHVARFHAEHPLQPGLGRAAAQGGLPGRVAPSVAAAASPTRSPRTCCTPTATSSRSPAPPTPRRPNSRRRSNPCSPSTSPPASPRRPCATSRTGPD